MEPAKNRFLKSSFSFLIMGRGLDLSVIIKWIGSSVSGLVVIAGIICIILSTIVHSNILLALGVAFVLLGLLGALLMTAIIRGRI